MWFIPVWPLANASLDGLQDLVVDPSSSHIYGMSGLPLAAFERDPGSGGQVSLTQPLQDDVSGLDGLMGAYALASRYENR